MKLVKSKSIALIAAAMLTSVAANADENITLSPNQPSEQKITINNVAGTMYIVRLADPALAVYEGGITGYEATSARATGKKKLDTKSKEAKKYQQFLKNKQNNVLKQAGETFSRSLNPRYNYQHAINGFAVVLTVDEAKALANMDGVVSVQKERMEQLLTDVGPQWIGAPELWNSNSDGPKGEGMVVAVLDSGINSDHPSFADVGGDGYNHDNPLGSGNYLPGSYCDTVDASFCNDKLIGAWDFTSIDGTVPEDDDGHGSHTASTAVGNVVNDALLTAPTTSFSFNISGVAPHANLIAYDVCQQTCPGSALVAAINQVLIDAGNLPNGIAALNYSISGGGDPYNDAIELGFLAAVEAGIYVSASAGNSGPAASTVAHLGPWVSTTAASTHNRKIANSLTDMVSDGNGLSQLQGSSFSAGYGPAPIIHANTTAFDPTGQCLNPFPPGTFSGEIVVCDRGTIARTAKGQNVLAGGAGGYVLANLGQGEGTVADGHFLPAIHIGDTDATTLRAWLAENTGTLATITPSTFNLDEENGDIMAGFSSRGPQQVFNVLKPDITAPGVDIMGAEANGQALSAPEYQIISGTSMSSPHNAGAGALLAAAHPEWTATEIKSAIMMTAVTENTFKEDGLTPTDPFDLGAGRIELGQAESIGLVMDESIANFLAANPAIGGDPKTLNIPSMMDNNCVGTCSWTRTVTNKTKHTGHWNVTVEGTGFDASVEVSPKAKGKANNLKLKAGESGTITITANNYNADVDAWQFGRVKMTSNGNSSPDLHMPMAVFASKASNPDLFTKTVDKNFAAAGDVLTYELKLSNGAVTGPITVNDKLPEGTTYVSGSAQESLNNAVTSSAWAYDAQSKQLSWTGELAPGGIEVAMDANGSPAGYLPLSLFTAPLPKTCNGNCDDGGFLFNVPAFTYNGETYNQVLMSVNGTLEAGAASGGFSSFNNQSLPDEANPNNILAPFWRDLNLNTGGNMYVVVLNGGGGSQWTAYEWQAVPHFGDNSKTVTMQVWIGNNGTPVEGDIHFVYGDMLTGTNDGGTVGAENSTGTVGMNYFYNGSGTAPAAGDELRVATLNGGEATLSFEVITDCSKEFVANRATLSATGVNETGIAVTKCQ